MKCPITGCENDLPEDAGEINVTDETFETKRHKICDTCYRRITNADPPELVSIKGDSDETL